MFDKTQWLKDNNKVLQEILPNSEAFQEKVIQRVNKMNEQLKNTKDNDLKTWNSKIEYFFNNQRTTFPPASEWRITNIINDQDNIDICVAHPKLPYSLMILVQFEYEDLYHLVPEE